MGRKMGKMWKDLGGYDQNIFSKKGFIKSYGGRQEHFK